MIYLVSIFLYLPVLTGIGIYKSRSVLPPSMAGFDAVLPAITISVLALIVGSLLTPKKR